MNDADDNKAAFERVDIGPCSGTVTGRMTSNTPNLSEGMRTLSAKLRVADNFAKQAFAADYRHAEERIAAAMAAQRGGVVLYDEAHIFSTAQLNALYGRKLTADDFKFYGEAKAPPPDTESPEQVKAQIRELNQRLVKPMRGQQRAQCTQQLKGLHQKLRSFK